MYHKPFVSLDSLPRHDSKDRQQKFTYEMRDNGVAAKVSYMKNASDDLSLATLRQQVRQQLEQLINLFNGPWIIALFK